MKQRKTPLIFVIVCLCIVSAVLTGAIHTAMARPSTFTLTDFYFPAGQDPWGIAFDSSGHVWIAIPGCDPSPTCSPSTPPGKIAEYDPGSSSWITTYTLPTGYAQPLFLAFDSKGNLWFTMPDDNSIGKLNLQNNTFHKFKAPTSNAGPWDLAFDSKGKLWFTEHLIDQIGSFNTATHVFKEFKTPSANSLPYGIKVDASNNIWFTENNPAVARIGEYTTKGVMNEYTIRSNPPGGLTPHMITMDHNGNIWWTEGFVGMIGELQVNLASPGTNQGVTEYAYTLPCPSCSAHSSGISVDSNGNVWFSDSLQNIIASFPVSGSGSFTEYSVPTQNGHPHDGLNVDSQNRVWFTEEFANKLGVGQ